MQRLRRSAQLTLKAHVNLKASRVVTPLAFSLVFTGVCLPANASEGSAPVDSAAAEPTSEGLTIMPITNDATPGNNSNDTKDSIPSLGNSTSSTEIKPEILKSDGLEQVIPQDAVKQPSTPVEKPASPPSTQPTIVKTLINPARRTIQFKAGKKAILKFTVKPAIKREVVLEQKVNGKWKKVLSTSSSSQGKVDIVLPKKTINTSLKSTWRIVTPATNGTAPASRATSPSIKVTTKPAYQTPGKYQKVVASIPAAKGSGYRLTRGMNGVKVAKVQRKLGMGSRWETMDASTMNRVRSFQVRKGIKATGVVNKETWIALKLPASQWTSLDTYRSKVRADFTSTKKQRIEIMINEAMKYRGSKSHYVWGGAGSPKQGADCSGLVLQALYAAGMNPKSITTVKHSLPSYRTSRELMNVGNMKKLKFSQKKRGDLVFFGYRGGPISHVGIYLGNGKFFDLREDGAEVRNLGMVYARVLHTKMTVVRPFP